MVQLLELREGFSDALGECEKLGKIEGYYVWFQVRARERGQSPTSSGVLDVHKPAQCNLKATIHLRARAARKVLLSSE